MNSPEIMMLCRAICWDESPMIGSSLYDSLMNALPQLNHQTRIVAALPSNGLFLRDGKLVIPLPPREVSKTIQEKTDGLRGRVARALWELFKSPSQFYKWGYHSVTFSALEQSTLDLERLMYRMEVSPQLSNKVGSGWADRITYYFEGYYDPVNNRLYWLCHEHELRNFEGLQSQLNKPPQTFKKTRPNDPRIFLSPDPEPFPPPTIPRKDVDLGVDWSKIKIPDPAPTVGKLDIARWFNPPNPKTNPEPPPVAPKPHDPDDFKD